MLSDKKIKGLALDLVNSTDILNGNYKPCGDVAYNQAYAWSILVDTIKDIETNKQQGFDVEESPYFAPIGKYVKFSAQNNDPRLIIHRLKMLTSETLLGKWGTKGLTDGDEGFWLVDGDNRAVFGYMVVLGRSAIQSEQGKKDPYRWSNLQNLTL